MFLGSKAQNKRVFSYDFYVKKTHKIRAGENFDLNFPTQYVRLEMRFAN
jgi:hypothetical protein